MNECMNELHCIISWSGWVSKQASEQMVQKVRQWVHESVAKGVKEWIGDEVDAWGSERLTKWGSEWKGREWVRESVNE